VNLTVGFSLSTKNVIGILTGIALTLEVTLGGICILTIFSLAIHEHWMSSRVFMSSLISLSNVL